MAITIEQALRQARKKIDQIDARLLLQHIMNVNHASLITHADKVLSSSQKNGYEKLVMRRIYGEPIAYLIEECDFFGLTFKITSDVLIPRPETELLVELALKRIPAHSKYRILDLGTGSGAIALTLAKYCPQTNIVAVDLSKAAVDVARKNADLLKVNNVCISTGNWFSELSEEKFDLIISNPPYVAENDPHLKQGDLRFEPEMALTANIDGLVSIRHIIVAAFGYLVTGGWLLLEHGYDQAVTCRQLLEVAGFTEIFSHPDLAGIMRVSGGQYKRSTR